MNLNLPQKQKAFTLIEIMVAAVILFSSIATVSMIYRGAFTSSEKANAHVTISGVIPAVLSQIREQVRAQGNSTQTELRGEGVSWGINYQWSAQQVALKAAPPFFDMESGNTVDAPLKYKLWQVDLVLINQGLNKTYQFKEVSWNEL